MISAVVLLTVEPRKVNEVGTQLSEIDGITEVFSVGGQYDLVAIIRVKEYDMLAELVTEQLQKVAGITGSETMPAFRVFSEHDLKAMYSLGMD